MFEHLLILVSLAASLLSLWICLRIVGRFGEKFKAIRQVTKELVSVSEGFMKCLFPLLLWSRASHRQQEKLDKVIAELSKHKIVAELAERYPEVRRALDALGVRTKAAGQ